MTGANADERDVLIAILSTTTTLVSNTRASVTIVGDNETICGRAFEAPRAGFTDKLAKFIVLRWVKNGRAVMPPPCPSPDLAARGGAVAPAAATAGHGPADPPPSVARAAATAAAASRWLVFFAWR